MSRVRVRKGENLTKTTIEEVISKLDSSNPITKKAACGILNIPYNTSRLDNIIKDHKEKVAFSKLRRKQLRNKPIDATDKKYIIKEYLKGTPLSTISEYTFRSVGVIKRLLDKYDLPERQSEINYNNPVLLPFNSIKDNYSKDDLVFSARYNCIAVIDKQSKTDETHGRTYRLWVFGTHNCFAYQPYYELANLTHIQKEFNITSKDIINE